MKKLNTHFYLMSSSPRRSQLLEEIGMPFKTIAYPFQEQPVNHLTNLSFEDSKKLIASILFSKLNQVKKWMSGESSHNVHVDSFLDIHSRDHFKGGHFCFLCADTLVYFPDQMRFIGKINTRSQAKKQLLSYTGKKLKILTAVGIFYGTINHYNKKQPQEFFSKIKKFKQSTWIEESSLVFMNDISENMIDLYLDLNLWQGKAGAFGVQDPGIRSWIESMEGSYTSIMGLPISSLLKVFKKLKIDTSFTK
jgi:septum formation protein